FADWDIPSKTLTLTLSPEPFDAMALHRNISAVGHDTDEMKAPDEAYEALHACCKYRSAAVGNAHRGVRGAVLANRGGVTHEREGDGPRSPRPGASLHWLGTGEGTCTDEEGRFEMRWVAQADKGVGSCLGFRCDTVQVKEDFDRET